MKNKNLKSLNKDKDWFMDRVGSKVLAKGGKNRFNGEMVIFDTIDDFKAKFPSKQYQCPNCNGISTNPQVCNSGKEIKGKEICDWKVFGLFGDLGKGIKVIVKDLFTDIPKPTAMFKPIELLEVVS